MVKIKFQIDSSKLPQGGSSISTAVAVGHPQLRLNDDPTLHPPTPDGPDYTVSVANGDNVRIYVQELNSLSTVGLAPCGIIVNTFGKTQLTDAIMNDATQRPIDVPNFDLDQGPIPDFVGFIGDSSKWTQAPPSWVWPNAPLIDQEPRVGWLPTYFPYVTFNTSDLKSGLLVYGVVFSLTKDGKNVQYFYFDPKLQIGSSS